MFIKKIELRNFEGKSIQLHLNPPIDSVDMMNLKAVLIGSTIQVDVLEYVPNKEIPYKEVQHETK